MLRVPDLDLPPDHPDRTLLQAVARRLDLPPERVTLVDTLEDYVALALAETPRVLDAERQAALTEAYLAPVLPALERLLRQLRAEVDPELRRQTPARAGKPYPSGQCLEITRAVQQRLETLDAAELDGELARACAALAGFRAAGGQMRRAWGDLRGQYFQNALIVGTLYVDVSNDTVVLSKPPVEILPFAAADFRPIASHLHYAHIARRYWGHRFLPNHIAPELAPYLPLIQILPNGRVRLGPPERYMLGLTLAKRFAPAEQALAAAPLPPAAFASLAAPLRGGPVAIPEAAAAGRAAALACCREFRAASRFNCAAAFNRAVTAGQEINRRLAGLVVRATSGAAAAA